MAPVPRSFESFDCTSESSSHEDDSFRHHLEFSSPRSSELGTVQDSFDDLGSVDRRVTVQVADDDVEL